MIENLKQDCIFTLRALRRTPGFSAAIIVTLALGRLVASLLYETSTHDPVFMTSVALLLLVVAVLASAAPAWRAMRADPVTALRAE